MFCVSCEKIRAKVPEGLDHPSLPKGRRGAESLCCVECGYLLAGSRGQRETRFLEKLGQLSSFGLVESNDLTPGSAPAGLKETREKRSDR